jgi:signal transduction histidine kinase
VRSIATPELAGRSGRAEGPPVRHPLLAGDRVIGELAVRPRDGQRLDRRTLRVLDDIVGLVAAALQLVEANHVLEQARGDLIALRAAERRAVRRELHDGLGPSLAGIGYGLAAVENLNRRVRGVRDLADEVTPSPLDGATLAEALDDLAARFDSEHLRVGSAVDEASVLPVAVQDAIYFIAAEALANAARHAGATRIDITVDARDGEVAVRVADDGAGIDDGAARGVGLGSMRERAEELGGSLEVVSGPGGTTVSARMPLRPPPSASGRVALAAGTPGP